MDKTHRFGAKAKQNVSPLRLACFSDFGSLLVLSLIELSCFMYAKNFKKQ